MDERAAGSARRSIWPVSVFDSIRHGLEKAGDAIEHTAEKAGDDLATAAERIAAEAKKDLDYVEKEAMTVLDDIKKDLSKVGAGIKADFEKAGAEIKSGIEDAYDEARGAVEQIPKDVAEEAVRARNALDGVADDLKKDLEKAAEESKKGLITAGKETEQGIADLGDKIIAEADKLEEAIEKELSEDAVRKALTAVKKLFDWLAPKLESLEKKQPTLAGLLDGVSDNIELGPITLNYDAFFSRIVDLAATADTILSGDIVITRSFVMEMVTDLGPTSVTINAEISILETFGDRIPELPMALFTEIADQILDELGVPE